MNFPRLHHDSDTGGSGFNTGQRHRLLKILSSGDNLKHGHTQLYYLQNNWNSLSEKERTDIIKGLIKASGEGYQHNIVYLLLQVDGLSASQIELCVKGLESIKEKFFNITKVLKEFDGLTTYQRRRLGLCILKDENLNASHIESLKKIFMDEKIKLSEQELMGVMGFIEKNIQNTALKKEFLGFLFYLEIYSLIDKVSYDRALTRRANSVDKK